MPKYCLKSYHAISFQKYNWKCNSTYILTTALLLYVQRVLESKDPTITLSHATVAFSFRKDSIYQTRLDQCVMISM